MYDKSYEDYMNSVLGTTRNNVMQMPTPTPMPVQMNTYPEMNNLYMNTMPQPMMQAQTVETLEEMYPDMYKMVFPMIVKRCEEVYEPVTETLINQMTDEIFHSIQPIEPEEIEKREEIKNEISINKSNLPNDTRQIGRRDPFLKDFIRVLLLRELIDGRFPGHHHNHHHKRPSMPRAIYGPYMY